MFSTVKAKVIAGVCAVAVVGGGITAAVMLSSHNSDDDDIVVSSQKNGDSTVSKNDETVSNTANDNKDSNLYWIDGFQGGTPSDTLPQDIFGSKISVPVDLSAIDGGNANMKMYGDDIGRSSDIMSVDK